MSKRKGPPEIKKGETEELHAQVTRTKYWDVMSKQTELRVTVPPYGGDLAGVLEAIENARTKSDEGLSPWADIKRRIGFDDFQATDGLQPTHQGHHGPVQFQPPERFSEEYFKRSACFSIQQAIEAMSDLSDDQKDIVLNVIGPHFMKAGRALAEARMRSNHLSNVDVGSKVIAGGAKGPAHRKGTKTDQSRAVLAKMSEYIEAGSNLSDAAYLTYSVDNIGTSEGANRKLFSRDQKKRGT